MSILVSEKTLYHNGNEETAELNIRWIDGLRGIAAISVVVNHLTLSITPHILFPKSQEDRIASIPQYPFVYAFFTGFPWVSLFLILSVYVNALKPLLAIQADEKDSAILALSQACFRRTLRLTLPVCMATFMSWMLTHLGAFHKASLTSNQWLNGTAPRPSVSIGAALKDLVLSMYTTWKDATNVYDRNLWCMKAFLLGSLTLYASLIATAHLRAGIRRVIFVVLFIYAWETGDDLVGMPVYGGVLLCELTISRTFVRFAESGKKSLFKPVLVFVLFVFGWYLISFPSYSWYWSPWYAWLLELHWFFIQGTNLFNYKCHMGIFLILISVALSPFLQRLFSRKIFLWLGARSLAIYLVHGPLLRSVFCWIAYAFEKPDIHDDVDDEGRPVKVMVLLGSPSATRIAMALPIFVVVTTCAAMIWHGYIEPLVARLGKAVEDVCIGKRDVKMSWSVGLSEARRRSASP